MKEVSKKASKVKDTRSKQEKANHKKTVELWLTALVDDLENGSANKLAVVKAIKALSHISGYHVEVDCGKTIMSVEYNQPNPTPEIEKEVQAAFTDDYVSSIILELLFPFVEGRGKKKTFKVAINKPLKVSGHWIDQQLRYSLPSKAPATTQLSIFDQLLPTTKNKIIKEGVSMEMINRRGQSTPFEPGHYKLLDCLYTLLNEKSKNVFEKDKPDYFVGDEAQDTHLGKSPAFWVNLYEISKIWNRTENPSGKTMKDVEALVTDLADNPGMKVLFKYERRIGDEKVVIEDYGNIIRLLTVRRYKDDIETTNEKGKRYFIAMHPVFIDQIASKWVAYPHDIVRRMIEAHGGPKVPKATYRLRDLLARTLSAGDTVMKITERKLLFCLAEKEMVLGRKSDVRRMYESAVVACKKIGLLKDVEITTAKTTGEPLYTFELVKKWE